jgi:phage-related protein
LKGFGSGVFEIVENYRGEAYRVVYALQVGVPIYILHAFQKKSIKGIKTLKKEIDVIRQRLKMVQEREHERRAI